MSNRKTIGKRLRFSIFARDGFTCRYCGRQSDQVELHIDHIIPVSKGGTNDESNLATACIDCNLGKSNGIIEQSAPNETDRLRIAQEHAEQMRAAKMAMEIAELNIRRHNALVDYWITCTGRSYHDKSTLNVIFNYVKEFGEDVVYRWVEKAEAKCYDDVNMGKYISGIRRLYVKEGDKNGR